MHIINDLRDFAATILLAIGALLPIVDPLGGAPIYLAMTTGLTPKERARMAKAVAMNSFLLLIASALVGAYVLDFFGVSIPAVQVAGGLVVCAIGWSLLNSPNSAPALTRSGAPDVTADDLGQRAFYPLTMPLTVGPGSISVAITIGSRKPEMEIALPALALHAIGAFFGVVAIALSIYIAYRFAGNLARLLGTTGLEVMVRLSAFILMCIGIQIIWNGWSALTTVAH